jgi:hypothetical protein
MADDAMVCKPGDSETRFFDIGVKQEPIVTEDNLC